MIEVKVAEQDTVHSVQVNTESGRPIKRSRTQIHEQQRVAGKDSNAWRASFFVWNGGAGSQDRDFHVQLPCFL
jgi:hypothetical protein